MKATQIGELARAVEVLGERDSLTDALVELWKGGPAVVLINGAPHLLHPADVVGHQETRRLLDLPLIPAQPVAYDLPLWRALDQTRDADFILVTRRDEGYAIASRQAVLEELLGASDSCGQGSILTVVDVLDQSPEGVVVLNPERRVYGLNPAGRRILGLLGCSEPSGSIDSLCGVPIEALLEDAKQGLPRDLIVHEPDCRVVSVRTLRAAKEPRANTVLLLRDVTHVRHRQAREAAQERMALLGQLSSGIAHDMNNVLTVVAGCASLMKPGEPASDFCLEGIASAVDRASGLVRQLLAFARRELTDPVMLSVPRLIRDIEGILRRLAGDRVQLSLELGADTPLINADPVQIERILTNLMVNARDAMPRGGRVEITVGRCDPCPHLPGGGSAATIRVKDSGVGMAPETLARVFEPYFTTDPSRGTGLGLATVHATVTGLRGHMKVESSVGAGTCFDICLPAVPDAQARADQPAPPRARRTSLASGTLLVADRDPQVAEVVRRVLGSVGYDVSVVNTAESAVAWTRSAGEPDLLIAESALMVGEDQPLSAAMQELHPKLRVLLMSGFSNPTLFEQSEHPLIEYIAKPFSGDALLEHVGRLIGTSDDG